LVLPIGKGVARKAVSAAIDSLRLRRTTPKRNRFSSNRCELLTRPIRDSARHRHQLSGVSRQPSAVSRQPSAVIKHVAPQELLFLPGHDVERQVSCRPRSVSRASRKAGDECASEGVPVAGLDVRHGKRSFVCGDVRMVDWQWRKPRRDGATRNLSGRQGRRSIRPRSTLCPSSSCHAVCGLLSVWDHRRIYSTSPNAIVP